MKTTIEIATPLFEEAKEVARQEGTTLRALVEDGLRTVLERRRSAKPPAYAFHPVVWNGGLDGNVDANELIRQAREARIDDLLRPSERS